MKLMVGCPVSANRMWVLPEWLAHVRRAVGDQDVRFAFVMPQDEEEEMLDFFMECAPASVLLSHEAIRTDRRVWDHERYQHMARLRNGLLNVVREQQPDFFLSLDSDILIHPDAIAKMMEIYDDHRDLGCVAVGSKIYMTERGTQFPSYGVWARGGTVDRPDYDGVKMVDIIMAIKLMSPAAYNVDYAFHPWGEDAGWSRSVTDLGGKFWWDGTTTSKHCMTKDSLYRFDKRVEVNPDEPNH